MATEGAIDWMDCSKVRVKSKLSRQPTKVGPNEPSLTHVASIELFIVIEMGGLAWGATSSSIRESEQRELFLIGVSAG